MSVPRPGDQVPAGGGEAVPSRDGGQPGQRQAQAPAGAPHAGLALLVSLSMAQFMVVLDATIVNALCPTIGRDFKVSVTAVDVQRVAPTRAPTHARGATGVRGGG